MKAETLKDELERMAQEMREERSMRRRFGSGLHDRKASESEGLKLRDRGGRSKPVHKIRS